MFRPFAIFVGLRYTRAKRRTHFISFISAISIVGITIGITALITVLSVMNGFEGELRQRILGMASHATVSDYDNQLMDWPELREQLLEEEHVLGAAPYVNGQAMLSFGGYSTGALIRGISPELEPTVSTLHEHVGEGSITALQPGKFGIVLGRELAILLGVELGDKVNVIVPQVSVTPAGVMPRMRRFEVVGIFWVDMQEYDRGLAIMHMDDASTLFRMSGAVTGLRLMLDDMDRAPIIAYQIGNRLPGIYRISDWTKKNANFFRAVKMEKTVMFVILTLIVAVAAFNIVSTLVMVVTDKQSDIAILRTIGATPATIMAVFIVQGLVIGLFGTLLGAVGGVSLAMTVETVVPAIEHFFNVQFLPPDVYYISVLPSEVHWPDVIMICSVSFVMTLLATIYPAWRASRVQPAEALRYE